MEKEKKRRKGKETQGEEKKLGILWRNNITDTHTHTCAPKLNRAGEWKVGGQEVGKVGKPAGNWRASPRQKKKGTKIF